MAQSMVPLPVFHTRSRIIVRQHEKKPGGGQRTIYAKVYDSIVHDIDILCEFQILRRKLSINISQPRLTFSVDWSSRFEELTVVSKPRINCSLVATP